MRTSPAASLLAAGEELRARWDEMAPTVKGQVVEEIVTVTILPSPKGLHRFAPDYVDLEPR